MYTMEDSDASANPERRLGVSNFPMAYFLHMILGQDGDDDDGGDTSSDTGLESDLDSDVPNENEPTNSDKDDEDEPKENPAPEQNRPSSSSSSEDENEPGNLSPAECLRRRVQKIRDYRDLLKSRQQVANVNFKYFIGRKKED